MYAVVRVGSKLDKALLSGEMKSVSPLFDTQSAAEAQKKKSKKPWLFRVAKIRGSVTAVYSGCYLKGER